MLKIFPLIFFSLSSSLIAMAAPNPLPLSAAETESKISLLEALRLSGRSEKKCSDADADNCLPLSVNVMPTSTIKVEDMAPAEIPGKNIEDHSDAIRELSPKCKAGDGLACRQLALISKELNKPKTAIQFFKLACENGDALICKQLGLSLEKAGKKDLATSYIEKACLSGDQKSCNKLTPTKN